MATYEWMQSLNVLQTF